MSIVNPSLTIKDSRASQTLLRERDNSTLLQSMLDELRSQIGVFSKRALRTDRRTDAALCRQHSVLNLHNCLGNSHCRTLHIIVEIGSNLDLQNINLHKLLITFSTFFKYLS